jgi:hypothetical protein
VKAELISLATQYGWTTPNLAENLDIHPDRLNNGGTHEVIEIALQDDEPTWIEEIIRGKQCARSACKMPLGRQFVAIWNEPATNTPRMYCIGCASKIIRGNQQDEIKLQYEMREPLTPTAET